MNATYKLISRGCVRYIGTTAGPLSKRLKKHLEEARGTRHNRRLNWLRSLEEPPTIELIEETTADTWEASEIYYIALAKAYGCNLVNGTPGGGVAQSGEKNPMFGKTHTLEWRQRHSARVSGKNHPLFGKSPSVETRAKMRAAKLGTKQSAERVAAKTGDRCSLETRAKMRAAKLGKPSPKKGKHYATNKS